jgi:hypothetical protein
MQVEARDNRGLCDSLRKICKTLGGNLICAHRSRGSPREVVSVLGHPVPASRRCFVVQLAVPPTSGVVWLGDEMVGSKWIKWPGTCAVQRCGGNEAASAWCSSSSTSGRTTALQNVMEGSCGARVSARSCLGEGSEALACRAVGQAGRYPPSFRREQQRVGIARTIAMEPDHLFDEPTSALDPELVGEVWR